MEWLRRNWQVLALLIVVVFVIDAAYSVLSTCDPVGEKARQATGGQYTQEHCSATSGPLLAFVSSRADRIIYIFDEHGEAVTAAFTVVLAIFTRTLWLATRGLLRFAKVQSEDMKASIAAAQKAAEAAELQAKSASRAELPIIVVQDYKVGAVDDVEIPKGEPPVYAVMRLNIANLGRTPAELLRLCVEV